MTVLLSVVERWVCPNCGTTDTTRGAPKPNRMHTCSGLHGMTAPLVREGTSCKVEAVEREDYVGSERGIRYDSRGKAIRYIKTTRDDGQDATVFVPRAVAHWGPR